ncbi:hypothetical protein AALC16_20595 [Lachnospiraceae bacterium 29-91]
MAFEPDARSGTGNRCLLGIPSYTEELPPAVPSRTASSPGFCG